MYHLYRGTYPEVYDRLDLKEKFGTVASHKNLGRNAYLNQINKDLGRLCCFSDQYNYNAICARLRDTSHLDRDDVQFYGYSQGDFDGRVFSIQYKFHEQWGDRISYSTGRSNEYYATLEGNISLTYVDDHNIICGIAIDHVRDDSDDSIPIENRHHHVAVSIIRNVQGRPEDREVLYIAHPSLLAITDMKKLNPNNKELKEKNVFKQVFAFTHSQHVNQLLEPLISEQGHLSLPAFNELRLRFLNRHSQDYRDSKKPLFIDLISQILRTERSQNHIAYSQIWEYLNDLQNQSNTDINFFKDTADLSATLSEELSSRQFINVMRQKINDQIRLIKAQAALEETLTNPHISPAFAHYGKQILKLSQQLDPLSKLPTRQLREALEVTNQLIQNPTQANIDACLTHAHHLPQHDLAGNRLRGFLMGLAGIALILASVALSMATLGAATPSIFLTAVTLGGPLISLGTSIFMGTAGTSVAVKGIFAAKTKHNPLKKEMESLCDAAHPEVGERSPSPL